MLKRAQVQRWFPDDEIVVASNVSEDQVRDGSARAMLCDVGLPGSFLEVMELDDLSGGIRSMSTVYGDLGEQPPPGSGDLLYLGYLGESSLALDGDTGAVAVVRSGQGSQPLATSLEAFIRVLGTVSQRWGKKNATAAALTEAALAELRRRDPSAPRTADATWTEFLATADAE